MGSLDPQTAVSLRTHHSRLQVIGNDMSILYGPRVEPLMQVLAQPGKAKPANQLVLVAAAKGEQVWGAGFGEQGDGLKWESSSGVSLGPIFNMAAGGGARPVVTCGCDLGHGVWFGLKGGVIARFDYSGALLPPLKAHTSDVQFIMRWRGYGALTCGYDGQLILWPISPIGAVAEANPFEGDGRRWMCGVEVPVTAQAIRVQPRSRTQPQPQAQASPATATTSAGVARGHRRHRSLLQAGVGAGRDL